MLVIECQLRAGASHRLHSRGITFHLSEEEKQGSETLIDAQAYAFEFDTHLLNE